MTRDEAIAEAERKQHLHPDAKWVATQRENDWFVARIGVPPTTTRPTGTASPPPVAPPGDLQSPLQRVTTLYGSSG